MCQQFFSSWEQFHVNVHLKCKEYYSITYTSIKIKYELNEIGILIYSLNNNCNKWLYHK